MGPDTTASGDVFFAPAGTPLPTGGDLEAEGYTKLGAIEEFAWFDETAKHMHDFAEAVTRLGEAAHTWSVAFTPTPELIRLFWFGQRMPKRARRQYDQMRIAARKRNRAAFRDAQRRSVGIKEDR
ncbi:hypothetical protein MUN77_01500 [Leucobacter allii]|uniref:hypothetical protein n=1 Tax=Leucobacter allii TaxID=2932247 RepID=UPI001FD544F7|nr:hypothetical protein [Leucobacter allii]UOR02034.1 hypothetical protein MUN77_01500 [Leucobacter allii]